MHKLYEIDNELKLIAAIAQEIPKQYKKKLNERIIELTQGTKLDKERIAQEIAIFADKASVDEEITRLYSHLNQMTKTLELNEPIYNSRNE